MKDCHVLFRPHDKERVAEFMRPVRVDLGLFDCSAKHRVALERAEQFVMDRPGSCCPVTSALMTRRRVSGLITSERTGSGHRRFPRAVLRRIASIVFAQKIGLSLDEVAVELSRLPHNRVPQRAAWAKLSMTWTQRGDERIAELQRLEAGLTQMHRTWMPVLQQCQLANPSDTDGRAGPGPRFWIGRARSATTN